MYRKKYKSLTENFGKITNNKYLKEEMDLYEKWVWVPGGDDGEPEDNWEDRQYEDLMDMKYHERYGYDDDYYFDSDEGGGYGYFLYKTGEKEPNRYSQPDYCDGGFSGYYECIKDAIEQLQNDGENIEDYYIELSLNDDVDEGGPLKVYYEDFIQTESLNEDIVDNVEMVPMVNDDRYADSSELYW